MKNNPEEDIEQRLMRLTDKELAAEFDTAVNSIITDDKDADLTIQVIFEKPALIDQISGEMLGHALLASIQKNNGFLLQQMKLLDVKYFSKIPASILSEVMISSVNSSFYEEMNQLLQSKFKNFSKRYLNNFYYHFFTHEGFVDLVKSGQGKSMVEFFKESYKKTTKESFRKFNQHTVLSRIKEYIKYNIKDLKGEDKEQWSALLDSLNKGHCSGFTYLYLFFQSLGETARKNYLFNLSEIAQWDGVTPLTESEKNIFEEIIGQLIVSQDNIYARELLKFSFKGKYIQSDPAKMSGILSSDIMLVSGSSSGKIKGLDDEKKLAEYINGLPNGALVEVGTKDHSMALIKKGSNKYITYDPNGHGEKMVDISVEDIAKGLMLGLINSGYMKKGGWVTLTQYVNIDRYMKSLNAKLSMLKKRIGGSTQSWLDDIWDMIDKLKYSKKAYTEAVEKVLSADISNENKKFLIKKAVDTAIEFRYKDLLLEISKVEIFEEFFKNGKELHLLSSVEMAKKCNAFVSKCPNEDSDIHTVLYILENDQLINHLSSEVLTKALKDDIQNKLVLYDLLMGLSEERFVTVAKRISPSDLFELLLISFQEGKQEKMYNFFMKIPQTTETKDYLEEFFIHFSHQESTKEVVDTKLGNMLFSLGEKISSKRMSDLKSDIEENLEKENADNTTVEKKSSLRKR